MAISLYGEDIEQARRTAEGIVAAVKGVPGATDVRIMAPPAVSLVEIRPDLLEATRLTRAGQLLEATALIQRALGGRFASSPVAEATPATDAPATDRAAEPPLEGSCRVIDIGPFVADCAPQPAQREPAGATAKAAGLADGMIRTL